MRDFDFNGMFDGLYDANDQMFRKSHYPITDYVEAQRDNLLSISDSLQKLEEVK